MGPQIRPKSLDSPVSNRVGESPLLPPDASYDVTKLDRIGLILELYWTDNWSLGLVVIGPLSREDQPGCCAKDAAESSLFEIDPPCAGMPAPRFTLKKRTKIDPPKGFPSPGFLKKKNRGFWPPFSHDWADSWGPKWVSNNQKTWKMRKKQKPNKIKQKLFNC